MTTANEHVALRQALARLAEVRVIPRVAAQLDKDLANVGRSLRASVLAEVPAFSASGNPEVIPELERHATAHVLEIRRLLGGGAIGDFEFVRAHAEHRAEKRFPLEATLHAYRCGHKVLSHWMRDAAGATTLRNRERAVVALADFAIEYTNAISAVLAAEYVAQTRTLAEAEGDRRTELLNILVSGFDESDGRVARLLKRTGYSEQRQAFCIVLAQSVDPIEMESPERAQRMAEAITKAIAEVRVRALVGIRNNLVTAVLSDIRRLSGWTVPQTKLADRIRPALLVLGPAVLIGVSSDQPSTAFIPKAMREASVALDFASVAERVVQFTELPIRRLMLHSARDYVQSALPPWIVEFLAADTKLRGVLIQTLRAFADADMNVLEAARSLGVHPNTIYARMRRINAITGRDGQRYHDLTELLLAADCQRV